MGALLFFLLFGGLIALGVWLVRKNRQIIEQRDLMYSVQARHAGWRYLPNPQYSAQTGTVQVSQSASGASNPAQRSQAQDIPFEFDGTVAGAGWRMWYDNDRRSNTGGSSSTMPTAVWHCAGLNTAHLSVMILPRWQYKVESGRVVGAIESAVGLFVSAVAGTDGHDSRQAFFQRAVQIKGSRPGFDQAFVALAGPEAPHGWLDDNIQALLMQWPAPIGRPSTAGFAIDARWDADGLRLTFLRPPECWPFWDQFGRLGQALAAQLVQARARAPG